MYIFLLLYNKKSFSINTFLGTCRSIYTALYLITMES